MAAFDPFANLSPIGGRKQQQQAPAAGQGGYGQSQPVSSNPFDTFGPSGAATNTNGQRGGGVAAGPGGGFIRTTADVAAERAEQERRATLQNQFAGLNPFDSPGKQAQRLHAQQAQRRQASAPLVPSRPAHAMLGLLSPAVCSTASSLHASLLS